MREVFKLIKMLRKSYTATCEDIELLSINEKK